jgi:hypothetical protein
MYLSPKLTIVNAAGASSAKKSQFIREFQVLSAELKVKDKFRVLGRPVRRPLGVLGGRAIASN